MTVKKFYEEKVVNELNSPELEAAFLGKSKESLDKIELLLSLDSAIPFLAHFYVTAPAALNQIYPVLVMLLQFLWRVKGRYQCLGYLSV